MSEDLFKKEEVSNDKFGWKGMPEFVQERQRPFSKIVIRIACEKDLEEFASLIGQKLTNKTKSIWHPKLERGKNAGLRYEDEP